MTTFPDVAVSHRRHWLPKREGPHEVGRTARGYCHIRILSSFAPRKLSLKMVDFKDDSTFYYSSSLKMVDFKDDSAFYYSSSLKRGDFKDDSAFY